MSAAPRRRRGQSGGQGQGGHGAQSHGQGQAQRSGGAHPVSPATFWRATPDLGPVEPIAPAPDPSALVRSLGEPPLPGGAAATGRQLAEVALRAARLATALATANGLLAELDEDEA
ncbi:MAG TPA: hypothetical protein VFH45_13650 [Acidimicrobiales bacterium]|nr:hypothetical protein [Acidimicrobiales bacterium]